MNMMEYKGYMGKVEFSAEDGLLYGKVVGIRALISYEGTTVDELISDFHEAVDEYLALCKSEGKEPEHPYKGSFNVRVSPELHRQSAIYAAQHNTTLNSVVETALKELLSVG